LDSPPPELARYLDALSPIRVAPSIGARLILVHGRADRAVPYTESLRLAAARPDRTTLVLVGLVEHVEGMRGHGVAEARDLFALWRGVLAPLRAGPRGKFLCSCPEGPLGCAPGYKKNFYPRPLLARHCLYDDDDDGGSTPVPGHQRAVGFELPGR